MASTEERYLWSDRKRYFGLPLSFTKYALSEDRLFVSSGVLNLQDEEILLYRVRDISVRRSLWQRLFGVGTIVIVSTDKSRPTLEIQSVASPVDVKELIHEQVEEMKSRRRVRYGEFDSTHDDVDFDGDDA